VFHKDSRMWNKAEIQIYIFSVKFYKDCTKILLIIFTHKKIIYGVNGVCVGIFLKLQT